MKTLNLTKAKLEKLERQISEIDAAIRATTGLRRASLVTRKAALEKQRAQAAKGK